jgi:hypothetical protein
LTLPADVASQISDASLAQFLNEAGCTGVVLEQRGNADLTDARNTLFYQVQFYCTLNAMPVGVTTNWAFAPYNRQGSFSSPATQVSEQVVPGGSNFMTPLDQVYVGPVKPAYLVSGHAELNWLEFLNFDVEDGDQFAFNTVLSPYGALFLNNNSVPYPVVGVLTNWGPSGFKGVVSPPVNPPYVLTADGCGDNYDGASTELGNNLIAKGYLKPGTGFQAHHIKPLCWGGKNNFENGIWLPTTVPDEPNLHKPFTTWFNPRNFTP